MSEAQTLTEEVTPEEEANTATAPEESMPEPPPVTAADLGNALRNLRYCLETHQVYAHGPNGSMLPQGPMVVRVKADSTIDPGAALRALDNASLLLKRWEKQEAIAANSPA